MKLYYFNVYGRAESIRFLLHHAKLPFEDIHINKDKLAELKTAGHVEFGQVPMFEVDGKHLVQSWSILRYLGKTHGYYPVEDANVSYQIDSLIDSVEDLFQKYFGAAFEADAEK